MSTKPRQKPNVYTIPLIVSENNLKKKWRNQRLAAGNWHPCLSPLSGDTTCRKFRRTNAQRSNVKSSSFGFHLSGTLPFPSDTNENVSSSSFFSSFFFPIQNVCRVVDVFSFVPLSLFHFVFFFIRRPHRPSRTVCSVVYNGDIRGEPNSARSVRAGYLANHSCFSLHAPRLSRWVLVQVNSCTRTHNFIVENHSHDSLVVDWTRFLPSTFFFKSLICNFSK